MDFNDVTTINSKKDQQRINELKVLESELKTIKKDSKVYKQQPNSSILFKEDKSKVFTEAKKELHDLIQQYKEAETLEGNPPEPEDE